MLLWIDKTKDSFAILIILFAEESFLYNRKVQYISTILLMSNTETICYIKNKYFLLYKKAMPKHCTQNYYVILAHEQKRGLENVLNKAIVINLHFGINTIFKY